MSTGDLGPGDGSLPVPPAATSVVLRSAATAIVIAWSLRLIGLVSVLVLARVLTPKDFGIVALATSVLALVDIFSALGLRQALLRLAKPERAHYDTAWTIQLLVLTVLAAVLVALGPVVASFYGEPALATIIPILAACFVIDGLGNIGTVDFERHFNFGRDLRMRLTVRLTVFAVTVSAALILRNYWALVIGMVLQSVLHVAASYAFHPYRPRFSLAKRQELLGVSLWMFLASASQTVHNQIEKIVVGRVATRGVLGFYAVSRDLSSIFTEEIATALNRVTFVTTAQTGRPLSADPRRLACLLGAYGMIAAPLGFGLAATAGEALPILLGPQWTGAAPLLSIIAPACALYAVYKLIVSTLQASGDARLVGLLSAAGAALMVATTAALALTGHGAATVAMGALAATAVLLAAGIALLAQRARTSPTVLAAAVARPLAAAAIMMLALQAIDTGDFELFARAALKLAMGAALFPVAVGALWLAQGRPDGVERLAVAFLKERCARLQIGGFSRW